MILPVGVILSAYTVSGGEITGGLLLQISYPIEQRRFFFPLQLYLQVGVKVFTMT